MPHFTVNMVSISILEKAVLSTINVTFLDCAPITLEDGVWVGANVTIATPCHPFLSDERLPQQYPDGFHDLGMQSPSISEAEAGFVRVRRSVAE